MSFLREPGDLSRTPLAAILLEAWNLRATGELTVHQPGGDSRLFFRDGMAVGAQTFAGFHPLGQILLGRGLIDIDTLGRSLVEVASTKRKQGDLLVEMGAVSREVVDRALEDQQAGYLSLIANLAEGGYDFRFDAPIPAWAGRVLVAPMRAVVDALATPQGAPLCASALALAEGPIALAAGYADLSLVFAWSAAEEQLLHRLGTASTAESILATPGLPVEQARAALAALLLLGLAEPAGEVVDVLRIAWDGAATVPPAAPAAAVEPFPSPTRMMPSPERSPLGHVPPVLARVGEPQPSESAYPPATLPPVDPSRRSDPEVARARRQRLLARAMQNMGVGPFAGGQPPPAASGAAHGGGSGEASSRSPGPRPPSRPTEAEAEIRRALLAALPLARESDLFVRLNLPRTATADEVKGAYLQLVKQFHPDRFATPALSDLQEGLREVLAALNEAYGVLSDRTRRTEYLARTAAGGRAPTEAAAAAARADFQKAEVARKAGDHARARLFLESAVRSDRSPDLLVALAVETLASGKPADVEKARRHLDEAMKDAGCASAFLVAGKLCRDEGDHDKAERHFRAALRADPRSEEAARELHQIQGRRQRRAEARADAKK